MKHLLLSGICCVCFSACSMQDQQSSDGKDSVVKKETVEQICVSTEFTPGIYEHFKNKDHTYEVVGVARYSEDPHQEFVVYKSLYDSELKPEGKKLPSGTLWIRPKAMFLELVCDPADTTKKVPRFKKIS